MSRAAQLRDLEKELKLQKKQLKELESKIIGSDEKVDFEVYKKVDLKRNEIYCLNKKISFMKQGKPANGKNIKTFNY